MKAEEVTSEEVTAPKRAAVYARQSKDRLQGIKAQVADCTKLCEARGWDITHTIRDNDLSASNGKARAGYEQLLKLITAGLIDIVVVSHVDRLLRKLADMEHLIDLCISHDVKVMALTGDIDLSNDAGRLVGRILAVIARGEMERKSARQKRGNLQAAQNGTARKATPQPFGWLPDRVTAHPAERDAVESACRSLLAGGTLSGICRDWSARGLRPHQAPENPWARISVATILRNPRIAGLSVYRGEEVGTGQWEPLVTLETYRAVAALLGDESRRRAPGVRTMLGGLARCKCGNHVTASANCHGSPIYRCNPATRPDASSGPAHDDCGHASCAAIRASNRPHVTVRSAPIDEAIGDMVKGRLREPDALDLLEPEARADTAQLQAEGQAIRTRRAQLVPDQTLGLITRADMLSGLAAADKRLAEIGEQLEEAGRESVLAPLLAAENISDEWGRTPTDRRRAVVDSLMEVVLWPAGRGARVLDPDRVVHVEWRSPA